MNSSKLDKLRQELDSLRKRGGIKSTELESIAKSLGRKQSDRGKEPTWINAQFPSLRPLSIPHHGTSDLNKFTARSILGQLEEDIEKWSQLLESDNT
jgi:hypothetical protein